MLLCSGLVDSLIMIRSLEALIDETFHYIWSKTPVNQILLLRKYRKGILADDSFWLEERLFLRNELDSKQKLIRDRLQILLLILTL